ncbi:nucleoside diphosphate kinase 2, chloroplastic [Cinnamomum micranthum f. kanehirae]|uniref:Nucleoside diphosphate kinase n=1 Tax=Cinnamomum micranthum f. kanehirae TaxID=337451 RepID=A0A443NZ64_9MAGN|nr:nucleoside diphosphate kinase 2, chloroplastic [Cinnamomum micranthum f. kanehirae]
MEGLAVSVSSCLLHCNPATSSSVAERNRNGSLSCARKLLLRTQHLAAFQPSPLLSSSPFFSHAKIHSKKNKPHIFLPHLVASMIADNKKTHMSFSCSSSSFFSDFLGGFWVQEEVEETYIMVKPDGVQRGLVGEIISRFEKKGFLLKGLKLFQCPKDLAEEHYKDLKGKSFFPKLIDYITSGPVVCMAWEGVGVVASARKLIGVTNPLQAEPGTIRGDLAVQTGRNVVHGSDSPENGKREIGLWFKEGEVVQWTQAQAPWLRE